MSKSKLPRTAQYKSQERKLEKLLLSLGYQRSLWPHELKLLSDANKALLAQQVDDFGMIKAGSRDLYAKLKAEHAAKVAEAKEKKEAAPVAPAANETGENASE